MRFVSSILPDDPALHPTLDQPAWLAVLLVPVILAAFAWHQRRRGTKRAAVIGPPLTVFALRTAPSSHGRLGIAFAVLGWAALAVGLAGPRWGTGEADGVLVGRDIVVVLDLSRSMLARDSAGQSRLRSAIDAATGVVTDRRTGGGRFGVVVFAARPTLLTPLTGDTDHVLTVLAELDPERPPPETRVLPGQLAASGTRLGAAVTLAVAAHDDRFRGAQEVLLFSDGDDPADDREWLAGIDAARQARIPVSAAGFGDPSRDSPIVLGGKFLESPNAASVPDPVRTRRRDAVLREVADSTGGLFLDGTAPDLARSLAVAARTRTLEDGARPQPRDRTPLFFGVAALGLLAAWLARR